VGHCLEPGLPLTLDGRQVCMFWAGHSINGGFEARITVIAKVMDVWFQHHSVLRGIFSGCLSDLGLGLGGLCLGNIHLGPSGECLL